MEANRDHVISIELSAEEWRAFVASEPQPINWLREQIREKISRARQTQAPAQAEPAAMV